MKKIKQFGAVVAAMTMFAASTFADDRPRNGSDWRNGRGDDRGWERRDERHRDRGARNLSAQGRITNLYREHGGYRIQLDRGSQWYYVPQSAWSRHRGRNADLRIGVSVRLGGGYYDDRGWIHCSDIDSIDDYGYRDRYRDHFVSGIVRRIDYRRDVLELRDERTGRSITVDARRADRRNRRGIDLADIRRGDYVELEGSWVRGNVFEAYRIDAVDSRR